MKAVVTGATGFVGRALCSRLRREGIDVVAAVRDARHDLIGVETVEIGDIASSTDWSFVRGADVVFHLAAHVHRMRPGADDAAEFHRVNVEATEALARAAAGADVRRIVFLSSVKVNGEAEQGRPFVESDPPRPQDDYARSKIAAEGALSASGAAFTIVRPPLVYGPGVRANFLELIGLVGKGMPLPLKSVSNARSLVYVENLVDAMIVCASSPAAVGQTYFVRDGEDLSTPELVRRIAKALGVRARLFPMPVLLIRTAAAMLGRGGAADRLLGSFRVDDAKIRRELGWSAPQTVDEGLRATAEWYKARESRRR